MIDKFGEALSLLWDHIWLFTAIVLTVALPGNVIIKLITLSAGEANFMATLYVSIWIEVIFAPLYIGALIYALARIKSGKTVTYGEAMNVGLRKWFALFAARFIASIFIGLGLLLLVVPGVMLALRYALLDPAVVLEDKGISESRARSAVLTAGRRWEIFGATVLFFLGLVLVSFLFYLPFGVIEALEISANLAPVEIIIDCVISVAAVIIQIVLFLYYWEAVGGQPGTGAPAPGEQQVPA